MSKRFLLISQSNSSPAPNDKMKEILMKTVDAAKALVSKVTITMIQYEIHAQTVPHNFMSVLIHHQKQAQANVCVTMEMVKEALDQLRGAVMIVYPMGLPPHDPIQMEFEDQEDLSGTQVKRSQKLDFKLF